jgi:serine/threonine protein kinase
MTLYARSNIDKVVNNIGDYQLISILGIGSFSTVFLAKKNNDSKTLAIKLTQRSHEGYPQLLNSVKIYTYLDLDNRPCKHIPRYYGVCFGTSFLMRDEDCFGIILEVVDGVDLFQYLKAFQKNNENRGLPPQIAKNIINQIITG